MAQQEVNFHLLLIKGVELRVRDRGRMAEFYRRMLGWEELRAEGRQLALGSEIAQLRLAEEPGAVPRRPRTTGLYHAAFLFRSRRALAEKIALLVERRWPLHGLVDHGVSEALYLSDPEGNGVELTVDKPYAEWPVRGNRLAMYTQPLSLEHFVQEGLATNPAGAEAPPIIGHLHLSVGDLEQARGFFAGKLGLKVTQDTYPGALFFAKGAYHHHFAANTWAGAGAPAPLPNATGLIGWELADGSAQDMGFQRQASAAISSASR
jgi:catechol 2,3-dioxygenase